MLICILIVFLAIIGRKFGGVVVGDYLKSRREGVGVTLEELSQRTRIRSEYLKALEAEDFEKIPGEVYIKGYIRDYLKALSTDDSEALRLYHEYRITRTDRDQRTGEPAAQQRIRKPLRFAYFIPAVALIVFIVVFYGQKQSIDDRDVESSGNTSIDRVVTMIPNPIAPAEADYTNKHLLEIEAIEDTWIFLQIDGNLSYSMLLKPGQERSWTAEQKIFLKIGNAGGIRIAFDGKNLGAPGKRGQIISLTLPESQQ